MIRYVALLLSLFLPGLYIAMASFHQQMLPTQLLLSIIEIRNTKTKLKQRFHIVPESEADVKKGKISVSSPFAKAFLGKQQGDIVEVSVPAGVMNFEILSVER